MGVRLFVRGADSNGHVANYVETEQIVEVGLQKSVEAIFLSWARAGGKVQLQIIREVFIPVSLVEKIVVVVVVYVMIFFNRETKVKTKEI